MCIRDRSHTAHSPDVRWLANVISHLLPKVGHVHVNYSRLTQILVSPTSSKSCCLEYTHPGCCARAWSRSNSKAVSSTLEPATSTCLPRRSILSPPTNRE